MMYVFRNLDQINSVQCFLFFARGVGVAPHNPHGGGFGVGVASMNVNVCSSMLELDQWYRELNVYSFNFYDKIHTCLSFIIIFLKNISLHDLLDGGTGKAIS